MPHAGLRDCLSVYGSPGSLDVNTVEPAVMQAIGIDPAVAAAIVNLRRTRRSTTWASSRHSRAAAPAWGAYRWCRARS